MSVERDFPPPGLTLELLDRRHRRKAFASSDRRVDEWLSRRALPATNSTVASAAEMVFTSMAMSARGDWRSAPASLRGVAARGWFLGRWIPTFLVLDGPILRFLTSQAFRRVEGGADLLRAVRTFFSSRDFILLRHAFAHWSFSWSTDGVDSEIVGIGRSQSEEVRATRSEIDAFHIVTFALVEAINEVFLERRPK